MPKADLPLVYPLAFRTNDTSKDSKMVNCYKETVSGKPELVKRPGKTQFTITPALTSNGQGLWEYNGSLFAVANGSLYNISTGTAVLVSAGLSTSNNMSWTNTLATSSPHPYMVMHDNVNGYYLDAVGNFIRIAGQIGLVVLQSPGAGYANTGTFTVTGTTGSGASGTFTAVNGLVTTLTLTNRGINYTGTLNVVFAASVSTYTGSIAATTLTVTGVTTGNVTPGQTITGTGITAGTTVVSQLTSAETPASTQAIVTLVTANNFDVADATGILVGQMVAGTGVPAGSFVTAVTGNSITINNAFTVAASGNYTFATPNLTGTYSVSVSQTVSSTTITSAVTTTAVASAANNSFPSNPVDGLVYLDGYVFAMDEQAVIWQSDAEDPTSWNPLNYITAVGDPDKGVGIAKHLNYLVAFKQWTTEFLYDAANATGSVLAINSTARIEVGCATGDSIQQFEETVVWMATTQEGGRTIALLSGLTEQIISNAAVERFLTASDLSGVYSWSYKIPGHTFYGLVLTDQDITLVYDLNEKEWHIWTTSKAFIGGGEGYFECTFVQSYPINSNTTYVLDAVTANVYTISPKTYVDPFGPISVRVVTPRIAFGSYVQKTNRELIVIGDSIDDVINVRHTNDDYANWSNYRQVDLSLSKPCLYNLGGFRRRAYELFYTGKYPLRLQFAEIHLSGQLPGEET